MSHTPEIWALCGDEDNRYVVEVEEGLVVAEIGSVNNKDARLMTAAPEMLTALEEVIDYFQRNGDDALNPTYAKVQAVIKKAKGES